jgi:hypothetical protein
VIVGKSEGQFEEAVFLDPRSDNRDDGVAEPVIPNR